MKNQVIVNGLANLELEIVQSMNRVNRVQFVDVDVHRRPTIVVIIANRQEWRTGYFLSPDSVAAFNTFIWFS